MTTKESNKEKEESVMEDNISANQTDAAPGQEESAMENEDQTEEMTDLSPEEIQIEELTAKVSELNDRYLRLSAEYDNYRKRTLKERMELLKNAGEGLLSGILPVVDDFERAIAHLDDASDISAVKEGIDLIYNKFQEFLKRNGVVEIESIDKDFDTDLHEAVTKIPAPTNKMKGKVIDCIEKGYMLNDKVMRFAKVVVGE
ncbi:molecular chaperone GrpE [Saccharicrinis carchari]|uniref:Protein GrpE n=1 Tax=Saccharicrinis carchari TaxID=1168039 RepID=A0A521FBW6_SACCC|nr:nucleotide exchange factor GrpE [Saccharicrinis carchari]SMO93091.1 molecular chaperone GrpE [Saccharicrinis carchari]